MRGAAIVLVVALLGPSVAGALCDLTCIEEQRAAPAGSAACHTEESDHEGQSLTSAASGFCHQDADDARARIAASSLPLSPDLVLLQLPAVIAPAPARAAAHFPRISLSPPDVLLVTTQLRI